MKLSGMSIMTIGFGLNILLLIALGAGQYAALIGALLLKMAGEFAFLFSVLRKQRETRILRYFPWFELYFIGYVMLLPFLVLLGGRVVWKGRSY